MKEMNTTARGTLLTQMKKECWLRYGKRVSVVHGGSCRKVSEEWLSARVNMRTLTTRLMEQINHPSNLMRSYCKEVSNAGSAGIDGLGVKERKGCLRENYSQLKDKLLTGNYHPQAVRK